MANRLVSNVIIVDSAAGSTPIVQTISNSRNHITKMHVNAIAFWSADTTGACQVACGNGSTGVIASFSWLQGGAPANSINGGPATQSTQFGQNQPLEDIMIPTLTAGTAWIYLA